MKFRKKPIIVEAVRFADLVHAPAEFQQAVCTASLRDCDYGIDGQSGHIHTLEGVMRLNDNDWIIKGVKGEFYPCKPDVFAATYEAIVNEPDAAERDGETS